MRRILPFFFFPALFSFYSCGTSKAIVKTTKPTYTLTYKLIANSAFKHLDASYLDESGHAIRRKDILEDSVEISLGPVFEGFVASISSTGYGATDSLAKIELQIFSNNVLVEHRFAVGPNPSLAINYVVE